MRCGTHSTRSIRASPRESGLLSTVTSPARNSGRSGAKRSSATMRPAGSEASRRVASPTEHRSASTEPWIVQKRCRKAVSTYGATAQARTRRSAASSPSRRAAERMAVSAGPAMSVSHSDRSAAACTGSGAPSTSARDVIEVLAEQPEHPLAQEPGVAFARCHAASRASISASRAGRSVAAGLSAAERTGPMPDGTPVRSACPESIRAIRCMSKAASNGCRP